MARPPLSNVVALGSIYLVMLPFSALICHVVIGAALLTLLPDGPWLSLLASAVVGALYAFVLQQLVRRLFLAPKAMPHLDLLVAASLGMLCNLGMSFTAQLTGQQFAMLVPIIGLFGVIGGYHHRFYYRRPLTQR